MLHLILIANGEPYTSTREKLKNTLHVMAPNREVIVHEYDLDMMKSRPWFAKIAHFPQLPVPGKGGRRDGYYCTYKPFVVQEVVQNIKDDDLVYYVDCSRHYRTGFEESAEKLCEFVEKNEIVVGAVADDIGNTYGYPGCLNDLSVWHVILPNVTFRQISIRHILTSSFMLKKTPATIKFVDEWAYYSVYTDKTHPYPLVWYHHTCEQAILNILACKYNFHVFYDTRFKHDELKEKNTQLRVINSGKHCLYRVQLNP